VLAWRLALGTQPDKERLLGLIAFLEAQAAHFAEMKEDKPAAKNANPDENDPELLALASLCQALWSSNAFLYVD
jgi:hypothetical protein